MSPTLSKRCPTVIAGLFTLAGTVNAANPVFTDQTRSTGIIAVHSPVPDFNAISGTGAVGDFNRDGWQDVFYPAGGLVPDMLFINNGDGTFTDRAADWGIAVAHRGTSAAVGDYNGDGWLDIYVTSHGPASAEAPGNHKLYRNNGDGTFTDVAVQAGVNMTAAGGGDGNSPAWGDYDLDGDLDLAVAGQTLTVNKLFRNDGNGTFTDVTVSSGIATAVNGIVGFAPRFVDMNGDIYPELIWIADFGGSKYLVNNGNGTFTDQTGPSGAGLDNSEMGLTVADFDEDGDFDFYVTTINTNNLYLNQGNHFYVNEAAQAGVEAQIFGWGTVAIDFNHDALVDLAATDMLGPQYFWRNSMAEGGPLRFVEMANSVGVVAQISGQGLSNFDYDNDGDQDLIFFPQFIGNAVLFPDDGEVKVLRNDVSGPDTNWLRVLLDRGCSTDIAPDGIGSVIKVSFGVRTLMSRIDGGNN